MVGGREEQRGLLWQSLAWPTRSHTQRDTTGTVATQPSHKLVGKKEGKIIENASDAEVMFLLTSHRTSAAHALHVSFLPFPHRWQEGVPVCVRMTHASTAFRGLPSLHCACTRRLSTFVVLVRDGPLLLFVSSFSSLRLMLLRSRCARRLLALAFFLFIRFFC